MGSQSHIFARPTARPGMGTRRRGKDLRLRSSSSDADVMSSCILSGPRKTSPQNVQQLGSVRGQVFSHFRREEGGRAAAK